MTSMDLRGKYIFEHRPDDVLVGEMINKLTEFGWTHEDAKFNKANISFRNPIQLKKEVKLARPIEISQQGQNIFQNEGIIELFITSEPIDAQTSEISIDFELIPWFHLDDKEIENFILMASQLWNLISKQYNINQICRWLVYTSDYPEEIEKAKVGWINILPPEIVSTIGKSKLLNAPAWRVEEIAENTIMVVISKTPIDSDRFEKIELIYSHIDPQKNIIK